jgi:RND superfamily putative drug exporter
MNAAGATPPATHRHGVPSVTEVPNPLQPPPAPDRPHVVQLRTASTTAAPRHRQHLREKVGVEGEEPAIPRTARSGSTSSGRARWAPPPTATKHDIVQADNGTCVVLSSCCRSSIAGRRGDAADARRLHRGGDHGCGFLLSHVWRCRCSPPRRVMYGIAVAVDYSLFILMRTAMSCGRARFAQASTRRWRPPAGGGASAPTCRASVHRHLPDQPPILVDCHRRHPGRRGRGATPPRTLVRRCWPPSAVGGQTAGCCTGPGTHTTQSRFWTRCHRRHASAGVTAALASSPCRSWPRPPTRHVQQHAAPRFEPTHESAAGLNAAAEALARGRWARPVLVTSPAGTPTAAAQTALQAWNRRWPRVPTWPR